MNFSFKEDPRREKSLFDAFRTMKQTRVEVGLPASAPVRSRWLLALHERGAPGAHIPPRPVVAPALAQESTRGAMAEGLLAACKAAAQGDSEGIASGFAQAGQAGADGIRAYIDASISPANSPVTVSGGWVYNRVAKVSVPVGGKGFNLPLVETGELYHSFGYEIKKR